mgnify:CR=1 FL=1
MFQILDTPKEGDTTLPTRADLPPLTDAEWQRVGGSARDKLLDHAADWKADLIVMGTRGLTGLKHVALGSVADKEPLPWNSKIGTNMNYRASVETLTNRVNGILDIL